MGIVDFAMVLFFIGAVVANIPIMADAVQGDEDAIVKIKDLLVSAIRTPNSFDEMGVDALEEYSEESSNVAVVTVIVVIIGLAFLFRLLYLSIKWFVGFATKKPESTQRRQVMSLIAAVAALWVLTGLDFWKELYLVFA